jgi:hypothetical protein
VKMRLALVTTVIMLVCTGCGEEAPERTWEAHAACLMEHVEKGATGVTAIQACKDLEPKGD